ncbi:hypothetical protein HYQ45_003647 [Verticillium longisporum]|uniref:Uncharacterized protein n=2 Tax=Verticillium TaxID=1036719 RepID=A0A366PXF1_VERDA|nr:hypothetical protein HYQ44_007897 [Verticillium longisporum]PNH47740.1 hypothetical protein VD0004_g598 [Verticillium dahliae]KAG7139341.1 hypothetical protein HYQ45_003647 [Verticillium longisporum]KAG7149621.1 hypothetical protein HYQ46_001477 [Verticillium longisporum]PNH76991.1 hypothetical protein VD0001_g556 [Verticillium dahliae]
MPAPDAKADFVPWEMELSQPSGSTIPDPFVILDVPSEFPRMDEFFMTSNYKYIFLNVFMPNRSDGGRNIFHGLNGLAMHSHKTGKTRWFYAGDDSARVGARLCTAEPGCV